MPAQPLPAPPDPAPQAGFAERVIGWQARHGRHDLPWQGTRDPYRIWLSEIMLQQTQVATVIPYYLRFLERFPDLPALAGAPLEAVLECWAGLGYYARARNLHRCAQSVVAQYGGAFPADPAAIAALPGIGRSTAAAIAAFAFGTRAAILDGNVKRVLARSHGITGDPAAAATLRQLWTLAEALLPAHGIEAYTQGLMDLGATVCTRGQPRCASCPLTATCVTAAGGHPAPPPEPRRRPPVPERTGDYLVCFDGSRVLLERRPPSGIWGGLLALPEGTVAALAARAGLTVTGSTPVPPLRHRFTHFVLTLRPTLVTVAATGRAVDAPLVWVAREALAEAALPTPVRRILATHLPGLAHDTAATGD